MTGGCARSHARARGTAFVLVASSCKCLFDARLDVAFGLAADGGKLGDNQIARALKHALLAERERLEVAQVSQILEHIGAA